jgi:hypothetical protein
MALLEELGDPVHRRRMLGRIGLALAQAGRTAEAEEVLAELRERAAAADPRERRSGEDSACAAIEANLALRRGDRGAAADWFTRAARAYTGGPDLRDLAEALVGVAATADDPAARDGAVEWLRSVCEEGGIKLLPRELAQLPAGDAPTARQRGDAPPRQRRAPDEADERPAQP